MTADPPDRDGGDDGAPGPSDREWFREPRRRYLRARATALRAVRSFFERQGFLEVDTPLLVPNPGLELHLAPFEVVPDPGGPPRYLATSPELQMKRLVSAGFRRVFQTTRSFRRGEEGRHHQPEFAILEWYRAGDGMAEVIADTEALVAGVLREVAGSTSVPGPGGEVDVGPPWLRLTVRRAFERWGSRSMDEALGESEERFYRVLVDEVEPGMAATGRGVVLTHWPASMASLARVDPDDPSVARRFETYAGGLELSNGFEELTDPVEQRQRFEADLAERRRRGLATPPIDERFLRALADGMPPTAGNALGFDRLVMLATGADDIADVVPFPQARLF